MSKILQRTGQIQIYSLYDCLTTTRPTAGRDAENAPLFCIQYIRKGKKTNNPTNTKSQATKTKNAGQDQEQRTKARHTEQAGIQEKEGKRKANTPQVFKPPNHSRTQKPHNQRKTLNPYKYTSAPPNPLKTPLKREIRHISRLMQESKRKERQQRDKR